jgi:hypothetical protein
VGLKTWGFERILKAADKCDSFPREGANVIKLMD